VSAGSSRVDEESSRSSNDAGIDQRSSAFTIRVIDRSSIWSTAPSEMPTRGNLAIAKAFRLNGQHRGALRNRS